MEALQTFTLKSGKIIEVDFLNLESILSIEKSDWSEIVEQFEEIMSWFKDKKNKKKYQKRYRLGFLQTREKNDGSFRIFIEDVVKYGNIYRNFAAYEIFDSEEEAVEYAINHDEWKHLDFVVIPYYKVNEEN